MGFSGSFLHFFKKKMLLNVGLWNCGLEQGVIVVTMHEESSINIINDYKPIVMCTKTSMNKDVLKA